MASSPQTFHSTRENTNYVRLCRLLVDVGAHVLRETFDKKRPQGSLDTVFSSPPVHAVLVSLKKKVLNPLQWGKLYPAIKSSVSSRSFDITLLIVLLRNICGLLPPATGWNNLPAATDLTPEADIVRIKCYRNTVYGHASEASVDDATFNQYWQDIQDALVRLGGACYQDAIDHLKNECMDPDFEEHYQELLKQWVKDEVGIKERLDEIEAKFGRNLDDIKESIVSADRLDEIEHKLDALRHSIVNPESKTGQAGVEAETAYTNKLKASVKSQTEFQSKFMASPTISSVRTDEIFTNLLIQRGRKPVEDNHQVGRKERLRQYGQVSETHRVKHFQEIFMPSNEVNDNPKSILLTGKAGIGKTLFSQKLMRDWADDKLFQTQTDTEIPDFKFAYLLTFRQMNLLSDDRVTLRELLNCSSVLDEHSNINESLFEYIVNHSEEVLIVIDGFDESSQQDYISSDLDEKYPNNVQEKMPVAALCAKLIKGKILRGSVVVITSRPDESDKMNRIHFVRYVEITGFSEQQVKEFIGKYFNKNENMKNAVLDHVAKNEDLVSFAHVPVLCFLMCSYMEYILKESMSTDALPVKTNELYLEVVNRFVLDHNKKEIPSEVTLDKLSELAAYLLLEKKFLFAEEDLKKFSLEEVERLKASGLLHCGPPFRKSFSQVTKHFCFTHLTLHEYLAARWFAKRREIPSRQNASSMVMQFMSGILSKETDANTFMEELLGEFPFLNDTADILLTAKCLAEYEDKEFAKNITKKCHREFSDPNANIVFQKLTDVDCVAVSFLLDAISALNEEAGHQTNSEQTFIVKRLRIRLSNLTQSGVRRIVKSLEKDSCDITELELCCCRLDDACAKSLRGLVASKLTELILTDNQITDAGVESLSQVLQSSTSQVTALGLSGNQFTDAGVHCLCKAVRSSTCNVTELYLSHNQTIAIGKGILTQLKHEIPDLYLRY